MSWKTADSALEGKGYVKIELDGDGAEVILLTEPKVVHKTGFRGQEVTRYFFGVVEGNEVKILDTSKKTCQAIAVATDRKCPAKISIVRRGVPQDPNTVYEITRIKGTPADAALVNNPTIQAAVAEAMGAQPRPPDQLRDPTTGRTYEVPVDDDTISF